MELSLSFPGDLYFWERLKSGNFNNDKMDKNKLKKEFNNFLDSASEEQLRNFLKFVKERREKKAGEQIGATFKDRLN